MNTVMRKTSSMADEVVHKTLMIWRMTLWLIVRRRAMRVVVKKMLKAKRKTLTISSKEMSETRNVKVLREVETMTILLMPILAQFLGLKGGESLVVMRKNRQKLFS